jgi:hypothetical protein
MRKSFPGKFSYTALHPCYGILIRIKFEPHHFTVAETVTSTLIFNIYILYFKNQIILTVFKIKSVFASIFSATFNLNCGPQVFKSRIKLKLICRSIYLSNLIKEKVQ